MTVSVIVPTFNEEQGIGATLDALFRLQGRYEVIVVDGGSTDRTAAIVEQRGVRLIQGSKGRGPQMDAGARASAGEAIWFLHADTHPPAEALEWIERSLEDPEVVAGNFALRFDGGTPAAAKLTWLYPHLRRLGLLYGDSGIFVSRGAYQKSGGFAAYPLFEDVDLVRRLKRLGRFVHVPCVLVSSSRRFEGRNFNLVFARWMTLQVLYWLGVSPVKLARWYAPVRARKGRDQ